MNEATLATTIMSLLILGVFLGFFIWAIRSGQLKNVEEAKYHVFRSERRVANTSDKNSTKAEDNGEPGKKEEGA